MSTSTTKRPVPPERSLDQRTEALQRANRVRLAQAALKRQTRSTADAAAVLLDPPEHASSMRVEALLLSMQRWGASRVSKILTMARISPVKSIGGLTERQRKELAGLLEAGVASKQLVGGPGERRHPRQRAEPQRVNGAPEGRGRRGEIDWAAAVEVLAGARPGDRQGEAVGSGRAER